MCQTPFLYTVHDSSAHPVTLKLTSNALGNILTATTTFIYSELFNTIEGSLDWSLYAGHSAKLISVKETI